MTDAKVTPTYKNGVDYSNYSGWQKVTTNRGGVYYAIPGTSLVYDPFTSQAKGYPVVWLNPSPEQSAIEKAKQAATPLGQAKALAGTVLGTVGGAAGINYGLQALGMKSPLAATSTTAPGAAVDNSPSLVSRIFGGGGSGGGGGGGATSAGDSFWSSLFGGSSGLDTSGATAIGSDVPSVVGSPIVNELAAQSGVQDASLMSDAAAATPASSFLGQALPVAGGALGAYGLYNTLDNQNQPKGSSGLEGAASGAALGASIGGLPGAGIGALIGGITGFISGGHKSTAQAQQERWQDLADKGVKGAAEQYQATQNMPDNMKGKVVTLDGQVKDWNFGDALAKVKAGQPQEFRDVYGNYQTFGSDWSNYSNDQKNAIVTAIANAGLYAPKKGDVAISDPDQALKIKDQVLSDFAQPTAKTVPPDAVPQTPNIPAGVQQVDPATLIGMKLADRINKW